MDSDLSKILKRVSEWNLATFERKGRDFTFTQVFPIAQRIHQALLDFRDNPEFWDTLPGNRRTDVKNGLPQLATAIEQMGTFNPQSGGDPNQTQRSIISQIHTSYAELYDSFFQPLELFLVRKQFQGSDIRKLASDAQSMLSQVQQHNEDAKRALQGIRDASLKASTATFADIFETQANRNQRAAIAWLTAMIASGVAILWFVWTHFVEYYADYPLQQPDTSSILNVGAALPVALSKFIFVSLLTVLFYQLVKNRNANMHLFMLNRHKANCLRTVKAMHEASEDPRTREVVLMHATKAIFELNETGFINIKEKEITGLESVRILDQFKQE